MKRSRWTTRVMVLPGAPLIESGPYRLASLVFYAGAALLRIQVENSALGLASPSEAKRVPVAGEDLVRGRESARTRRALSIEAER